MANKNITINFKISKRRSYFEIAEAVPFKRNSLNDVKINLKVATSKMNQYFKQFNLELDFVKLREILPDNNNFEMAISRERYNNNNNNRKRSDARIYKVHKIKDQTNTSENSYLKWATLNADMPSLYAIRCLTKRLNAVVPIISNEKGYFVNIKEKILIYLTCYFKNHQEDFHTLKLKFSVDGFQVTRRGLQYLIFSFSFIQPQIKPTSSDGHHIIGNYFQFFIRETE